MIPRLKYHAGKLKLYSNPYTRISGAVFVIVFAAIGVRLLSFSHAQPITVYQNAKLEATDKLTLEASNLTADLNARTQYLSIHSKHELAVANSDLVTASKKRLQDIDQLFKDDPESAAEL